MAPRRVAPPCLSRATVLRVSASATAVEVATVKIGTRGSPLALAQAYMTRDLLKASFPAPSVDHLARTPLAFNCSAKFVIWLPLLRTRESGTRFRSFE